MSPNPLLLCTAAAAACCCQAAVCSGWAAAGDGVAAAMHPAGRPQKLTDPQVTARPPCRVDAPGSAEMASSMDVLWPHYTIKIAAQLSDTAVCRT